MAGIEQLEIHSKVGSGPAFCSRGLAPSEEMFELDLPG